ncbi:MAG: potassium channel family protein [Planctomycetota bacterium]
MPVQEVATESVSLLPIILVTVPTVVTCVLLHWAALNRLILFFKAKHIKPQPALLIGVLVLLALHVVEITLFAGVLHVMWHAAPHTVGGLDGLKVDEFFDVWYFSACVYTTVGFGDIVPTGPARFYAGVEALAGLLMITWSASFTFLVMQRAWIQRFEEITPAGR